MVLNHLFLLAFIIFLFVLSAFLAQKTDKKYIIRFGIFLLIIFFLTVLNLLTLLIK